jgi:hypothetical protein
MTKQIFKNKLADYEIAPNEPTVPIIVEEKQCQKCLIKLGPVMNYSCPHENCPCGIGNTVFCG